MRIDRHGFLFRWTVSAVVCMVQSACAVELIDDIIDERGVTYCSETTEVLDTSTSTGTSGSSGTTVAESTTFTESSTTDDPSTSESTIDGSSSSTVHARRDPS